MRNSWILAASLPVWVACAASGPIQPAPARAPSQPGREQLAVESKPSVNAKAPAAAESGQDASPLPGAEPGLGPTLELPQGTKVLHVGDSFAGALGIPLGKRLEAKGVRSVLKSTDASYLTDWAWNGDLQKQIWKYNPDLVLLTLGANELKITDPEARTKTVKKLVSLLGGRPCVWIAIPLWNGPENGLLEVIRENVAPCRFLDTNALMDTAHMARIQDGIHPTASAREAWADLVLDWLVTHREPNGDKPWALRE